MNYKKACNLDTPNDYHVDDSIEDTKLNNSAAVNKEYVNSFFLKKRP